MNTLTATELARDIGSDSDFLVAKNAYKEIFGRQDRDPFSDLEACLPSLRSLGTQALWTTLHKYVLNYTFVYISYK